MQRRILGGRLWALLLMSKGIHTNQQTKMEKEIEPSEPNPLQYVCSCGSRKHTLTYFKQREGFVDVTLFCQDCGMLTTLEIAGKLQDPQELEPTIKGKLPPSYLN